MIEIMESPKNTCWRTKIDIKLLLFFQIKKLHWYPLIAHHINYKGPHISLMVWFFHFYTIFHYYRFIFILLMINARSKVRRYSPAMLYLTWNQDGEPRLYRVIMCLDLTSNTGTLVSGFAVAEQNPHRFWSLATCHEYVSALRKIWISKVMS